MVRLGGVVTSNPRECTHMVTSRIARTIKFLSGISVCTYVVTPRWVEESGKAGIFRDEEGYILQDLGTEQQFGLQLSISLTRAKSRKLLEGMVVYPTPSVQPPPEDLGNIVGCAGGRVLSLEEVRAVLAGGEEWRREVAPRGVIILSTEEDMEGTCCREFTDSNISRLSDASCTGDDFCLVKLLGFLWFRGKFTMVVAIFTMCRVYMYVCLSLLCRGL